MRSESVLNSVSGLAFLYCTCLLYALALSYGPSQDFANAFHDSSTALISTVACYQSSSHTCSEPPPSASDPFGITDHCRSCSKLCTMSGPASRWHHRLQHELLTRRSAAIMLAGDAGRSSEKAGGVERLTDFAKRTVYSVIMYSSPCGDSQPLFGVTCVPNRPHQQAILSASRIIATPVPSSAPRADPPADGIIVFKMNSWHAEASPSGWPGMLAAAARKLVGLNG